MARDVHIHVCMPGSNENLLPGIAAQYLPTVSENRDAAAFLTSLVEGIGTFHGFKGSLTMWGYVGNYVHAEDFVNVLRPFWHAVYQAKDADGEYGAVLLSFERILVFYEHEQSLQAHAYEISLEQEGDFADRSDAPLVIKHFDCPFSWGQY